MHFSLVTITRDRPEFLVRLLTYYANHNLKAPIFIGDASQGAARDAVVQAVRQFDSKLNIELSLYENDSPPVQRLKEEVAKVDTECVAWVGDDDFLVPETLDFAINVLRQEPECAAVIGKAVAFSVDGDHARGRVLSIGDYLQLATPQDHAVDRLLAQARQGAALTYSLRRTSTMREILQTTTSFPWPDDVFGYMFFEWLDGFLTVLSGRVVAIDRLSLARQVHAGSTAVAGWSSTSLYSLITHPQWPQFIAAMTQMLSDKLRAAESSLTTNEVREATERALWIRVAASMNKGLSRELSRHPAGHLGLKQLFRAKLKLMFPQAVMLTGLIRQRLRFCAPDFRELSRILAAVSF